MSAGERQEARVVTNVSGNGGGGALALPSYLRDLTYDRTEINKAVKPPLIKYINYQSKPPYKPPFADFDIIIAPNMIKIGDKDNPFTFSVILYVPTFNVINPYSMKGKLPFVRDFSYDENSDIAKKCKRFCKTDPCPEAPSEMLEYRHTHNFFIVVEDVAEFEDVVCWMPLSKGEFASGLKLVDMMFRCPAPPPCTRLRCHSGNHSGQEGNWIGLNFLPNPERYHEEARAMRNMALYEQWKELISDRAVDLSDDSVYGETVGEDASNESRF